MKLDVRDREGKKLKSIDVDEQVFGLKPHRSIVHQALVAGRANRRQGTHKVKTRGEVRGTTAKLFRQKGTGRARQGSIRAGHRRGGGVIFGPTPRSYRQDLPKRMRRLAIRSILSAKTANGSLQVIDSLAMDAARTKEMISVLQKFKFDRTTLVVTAQSDTLVKLSVRNLGKVNWMPASYINVADLMGHRGLLLTVDAIRVVEALWGGERATKRRAAVPEVAAHG